MIDIGINTLEKILTSQFSLSIILALGLIWLARRYQEKDNQNAKLAEKLINLLEVKIELSGPSLPRLDPGKTDPSETQKNLDPADPGLRGCKNAIPGESDKMKDG